VVGGATVLRYDGAAWKRVSSGPTAALYDVWRDAQGATVAVGEGGVILHHDGTGWRERSSGTSSTLRGVWGSSANNVFVVGDAGTILHGDGFSWTKMASGSSAALRGVWGNGPNDVIAVGDAGTILRYDGSAWAPMTSGTTGALYAVWGSTSFAVAAGDAGLRVFNGTGWSQASSAPSYERFRAVWGSSPTDVYAGVGDHAMMECLYHFDGSKWSYVSAGFMCHLGIGGIVDISGSSASNVFAIGSPEGMRYDGSKWLSMPYLSSTLNGVCPGSSVGSAVLVGNGGTIIRYSP